MVNIFTTMLFHFVCLSFLTEVFPYDFGFQCGINNIDDERIIKGDVVENGEIPWQALLKIKFKGIDMPRQCGGVVVTEHIILTAAHCIVDVPTTEYVQVVLSAHNLAKHESQLIVNSTFFAIHPRYGIASLHDYDAGIVYMVEAIQWSRYSHIRPICLPPEGDIGAFSGSEAVVSGWGITGHGTGTTKLRKASLTLLQNERCSDDHVYGNSFTNNMICAGSKEYADACQGDSGGPLASKFRTGRFYELLGIVSWGRGCGKAGFPGVFTSITPIYSWLHDIISMNPQQAVIYIQSTTAVIIKEDDTTIADEFAGKPTKQFYEYNFNTPANYTGDLVDGKRSGRGRIVYPNGDTYVGDWFDNKKWGYGEYRFGDGSRYASDVYKGMYINDEFNGQGTYWFGPKSQSAGDVYNGTYEDNLRDGYGVYRFGPGSDYESDVYEGLFEKGKQNGFGIYRFGPKSRYAGQVYEGEFKNGSQTGHAIFRWPDGRWFEGMYVNGVRHGHGKMFEISHDEYVEGEYKNDKRVGVHTKTDRNGEVTTIEYIN